jgi:hypothetical protein
MPLVIPADYNKFSQSHPIYRGSGLNKLNIKNNNNNKKHPIYHSSSFARSKSGGFLNYNDIISGASKVINAIQDNKDLLREVSPLIHSGMSTASSIANAVESVSNAVKSSKDAEALNIINKKKSKQKQQQNSDTEKFTPEQEAKMRNLGFIGNGFVKY